VGKQPVVLSTSAELENRIREGREVMKDLRATTKEYRAAEAALLARVNEVNQAVARLGELTQEHVIKLITDVVGTELSQFCRSLRQSEVKLAVGMATRIDQLYEQLINLAGRLPDNRTAFEILAKVVDYMENTDVSYSSSTGARVETRRAPRGRNAKR